MKPYYEAVEVAEDYPVNTVDHEHVFAHGAHESGKARALLGAHEVVQRQEQQVYRDNSDNFRDAHGVIPVVLVHEEDAEEVREGRVYSCDAQRNHQQALVELIDLLHPLQDPPEEKSEAYEDVPVKERETGSPAIDGHEEVADDVIRDIRAGVEDERERRADGAHNDAEDEDRFLIEVQQLKHTGQYKCEPGKVQDVLAHEAVRRPLVPDSLRTKQIQRIRAVS